MNISRPEKVELRKPADLRPFESNPRTHSDEQIDQIVRSIEEFGWTNPVLIDDAGGIIAGHGRVMAAERMGLDSVPCIRLEHLTPEQRRAYVIADNQLALQAGWDEPLLATELKALDADGFDLSLLGFDDGELADLLGGDAAEGSEPSGGGSLSDEFLAPPFSVLNAREGWWQERKRAWIGLGIESEVGRDAVQASLASARNAQAGTGDSPEGWVTSSIFDPVLCEIVYSWFCPPGGTVLDPFAGGSVRGIVASRMGRQYAGQELRAEQVEANRAQADEICGDPAPVWHTGDSREIDGPCGDVAADLLFTCPPYADLERYSDDPADLSTLAYAEFREAYFEIIAKACALLKQDRFACIVVGEVRDKRGHYYDFVGDTVQAFRDAGLGYYNEAILVTSVGSLPIRAGRQFSASRKLGKTHQNVLVFVKGDGKRAAQACGDVEVYVPDEGGDQDHSDLGEPL